MTGALGLAETCSKSPILHSSLRPTIALLCVAGPCQWRQEQCEGSKGACRSRGAHLHQSRLRVAEQLEADARLHSAGAAPPLLRRRPGEPPLSQPADVPLGIIPARHTPLASLVSTLHPDRCLTSTASSVYIGMQHMVLPQSGKNAHLISLTLPESMTKPTSSMVMDVSATLVATTTFRTSAGGRSNTRTCSMCKQLCIKMCHLFAYILLLCGHHNTCSL